MRVAIGALPRGLCLFGGRGRRIDDRSRLGRPGRHFRDRRVAVRDAALQRRPRDRGGRCRCRPHPPGAHAHEHVRRQCAAARPDTPPFRRIEFDFAPPAGRLDLRRRVERFPFVPSDPAMLRDNCYEAYNIQVQGLAQRLKATGLKRLVIGVSGGLDSTQALIVSARAMDSLGLPRANILAYTLPGFATSSGTKANAWRLMRALGVTGAEIDIRPAANQMLADIGHASAKGEPLYDVTFENVQAGLRTDYLFRLANNNGGLVVGTGDLSELALGWCTYGVGDQMSHYNPNGFGVEDADPAPDPLCREQRRCQRGDRRGAVRHSRHRDLAGTGAGRRRRRDPVDRERCRPLRTAGFQPVLHDALRLRAVEDCLPFVERVARRRAGRVAGQHPGERPPRLRSARDQAAGCACFCGGFSSRASSSARPCRTGRKSRRAAPCRRAATGARRPIRMPRCGSTNSSATSRTPSRHC